MSSQIDPVLELRSSGSASFTDEGATIGTFTLASAALSLPSGVVIRDEPVSVATLIAVFTAEKYGAFLTARRADQAGLIGSVAPLDFAAIRKYLMEGTVSDRFVLTPTTVPAGGAAKISAVAAQRERPSSAMPALVPLGRAHTVAQLNFADMLHDSLNASRGASSRTAAVSTAAGRRTPLIYVPGASSQGLVTGETAASVLGAGVAGPMPGAARTHGGAAARRFRHRVSAGVPAAEFEIVDSAYQLDADAWEHQIVAVVLNGRPSQIDSRAGNPWHATHGDGPRWLRETESSALLVYFPTAHETLPPLVREAQAVVAPPDMPPKRAQAFFWRELVRAAAHFPAEKRALVLGH